MEKGPRSARFRAGLGRRKGRRQNLPITDWKLRNADYETRKPKSASRQPKLINPERGNRSIADCGTPQMRNAECGLGENDGACEDARPPGLGNPSTAECGMRSLRAATTESRNSQNQKGGCEADHLTGL